MTPTNFQNDTDNVTTGISEEEALNAAPGETTIDNDISDEELALLDNAGVTESEDDDDLLLEETRLDNTDEDGDQLNEDIDNTGDDLDVPGSDDDDEIEAIGEEDEENNSYSLSDQDDNDDDDEVA